MMIPVVPPEAASDPVFVIAPLLATLYANTQPPDVQLPTFALFVTLV
jgi:hypothetical protein